MNKSIIDKRNVGKTTYLFSKVKENYLLGKKVIVLDSATDHPTKSLIKKVENEIEDCQTFFIDDIRQLPPKTNNEEDYFENIRNYIDTELAEAIQLSNQVVCIDLSGLLEKGYEELEINNDRSLFDFYRDMYRQACMFTASALIELANENPDNDIFVAMDEIEFPVLPYSPSSYQGSNIEFLASVHPENSFGTFYKSFAPDEEFKPYVLMQPNERTQGYGDND